MLQTFYKHITQWKIYTLAQNYTQPYQDLNKTSFKFWQNSTTRLTSQRNFTKLYEHLTHLLFTTTLHNCSKLYKTLHNFINTLYNQQLFTHIFDRFTQFYTKLTKHFEAYTTVHNFTTLYKHFTQLYTILHNFTKLYPLVQHSVKLYNTFTKL